MGLRDAIDRLSGSLKPLNLPARSKTAEAADRIENKYRDTHGRERDMDERGWPKGTERWEDRSPPAKHKVYAFNPPTSDHNVPIDPKRSIEAKGVQAYRKGLGDHAPVTSLGRLGLGKYYKELGMRSSDVDRRTRAQNLTGKDYLDVKRSYQGE